MSSVVVIGAGHAAIQLAASLRQGRFEGPITLIADAAGLPYQRPPLSKAYLAGHMDEPALALRPASFYAAQSVGLVENDPAVAIDRTGRSVITALGARHGYDHLVLATGAANRALPVPGAELPGVVGLRSLAEARALKAILGGLRRVVVIGAGFIGLEFAAVAAERGIAVTVIEAAPRPLMRGVSVDMSAHLAGAHRGWGTRLLTETGVRAITGSGRAEGVELSTGEIVPADLVLVAIGVVPNVQIAEQADLAVGNGIVVDAMLATDDPMISAIGDCAAFPMAGQPGPIRLESVQNASDQARCLADRLLGKPAAYAKLPWFWSDQGALKLQIAGLSGGHDRTVLRGDPASGAFSVFCYRDDRLLAVESLNRAPDHMAARRFLAAGASVTPAQAADPMFDLRTVN
ncbi:MAG: FAD-dependent oxidoreductase [Alphaproteobacteria bacterium]|nr:FAD-dependent oxidoreductase [Alphaproteobacteria bacterium]